MVSKTIVTCLAVIASMSMIQATQTSSDFSSCVKGIGYLNDDLHLGVDLDGLLSNVLNLAEGVINGVLNTVSGLTGGLLGSSSSHSIPYPSNFDQLVQVNLKFLDIFDRICTRQFGTNYRQGTLLNVYLSLLNAVSANIGLNIGSGTLQGALSLDECRSLINGISLNVNAGLFGPVSGYIQDYIGLVNSSIIDAGVIVDLHILSLKIQAAILTMGNYADTDLYVSTMLQAVNPLFQQNGLRVIAAADVGINGVQRNCGCLNKN